MARAIKVHRSKGHMGNVHQVLPHKAYYANTIYIKDAMQQNIIFKPASIQRH